MPIRTPIIAEIGTDTYLIQEFGISCFYALCRPEGNLLIDAGSGLCNLPSLTRRLFQGRCFTLLLTHAHPDHAGGVHTLPGVHALLHPAELASCRRFGPEDRQRMRAHLDDLFTLSELPPWQEGILEPLPLSGDAIGAVEPVYIGGHTDGSMAYIDAKTGIAFVGDAVGPAIHAEGAVSELLTGLVRLKSKGGFDRMYGGHMPLGDYRGMPLSMLDDTIGACRAALDPESAKYAAEPAWPSSDSAVRYGQVQLDYCAARIWAEGEHQSPFPLGL